MICSTVYLARDRNEDNMSDASELLRALSKLIRRKREEIGMSQTELAERSGLHRTYINNIERGTKNISIESVKKIADALNLPVSDLLSEAESDIERSVDSITILLVEDNPADVFMFKRCVKRSAVQAAITVIESGKDAQRFLRKIILQSEGTPDMIFLDLNLPGRSGHELLSEIKTTDALKHIPVVILTTSNNPKDVRRTYGQFANSFLTKPIDPREYQQAIEDVLKYWLNVSSIPR